VEKKPCLSLIKGGDYFTGNPLMVATPALIKRPKLPVNSFLLAGKWGDGRIFKNNCLLILNKNYF
jgi:hypothetical protein